MLVDMIEILRTYAALSFESFPPPCLDAFVYHTRCCWTVGFHGSSLQQQL